ncbi:hypothetical protein BGW38_008057 [Lunasporangiospora selenospora]|uniref:BRISC and BRCA1-A complex member 2 n=1 Tax=Lunasporangiospora selenospora TaxID=979761 RepID=A0A9P6G0A6_9FUNG|nr:hypothetical protein BGW38_008057 [Lunasporangiospora selenospora]
MSLYTTAKNSRFLLNHYLSQSLNYLSEQAAMTLFSLRNVNVGSSQTVFNPNGSPIADRVEMTMRVSSIGTNTIDLRFFYDPHNWAFPPDLIIQGMSAKLSPSDIGLDHTWNYEDPSNLGKVLTKISRLNQHDERQRVATFENERIQVEYSCLQDREEMDCHLIPGSDGPTKVLFAVPFFVSYSEHGKAKEIKAVAKIQFLVSSLVPNGVAAAKSKIETLSPLSHRELLNDAPEIGIREPITTYIDRITKRVADHFAKEERAHQLKIELVEMLASHFKTNLLEYDTINHTYAAFMFTVPVERLRPESYPTAIATFYMPDNFPDEYPKLTLSAVVTPTTAYASLPPPETIPIVRYSPRWGAERILTELWEQLWDEIPQFHSKVTKQATGTALSP